MTLRILICAFLATLATACIKWFATNPSELVLFYEKYLRGNLFAGFLTVGSFLLSLKTFILIKLKENVYDHEEYKKIYREQKELDSSLQLYGPLKSLSDFLFWSVLSAIIAAVAQLTIGLLGYYWLVLGSLWLSFFALSILIASLILIKGSLNDWFDFINHADE
ncbi:MAG: hypothetical protein GX043_07475 [Desulfovibrionales bacterium]|nr:hypothetical protein [Desulfovibrionales bacterium]